MYTLKKLQLEEGKDSLLPTGYETTAEDLMLFDYVTDARKDIELLKDVQVGWQVILYESSRPWNGKYHRTSKISEILESDPSKVVFKTQTSIYELRQHND